MVHARGNVPVVRHMDVELTARGEIGSKREAMQAKETGSAGLIDVWNRRERADGVVGQIHPENAAVQDANEQIVGPSRRRANRSDAFRAEVGQPKICNQFGADALRPRRSRGMRREQRRCCRP